MHIQLAKRMVQYIIDCAYQAVPNNENNVAGLYYQLYSERYID